MKDYIIMGEGGDDLEAILEREDVQVLYKAKHVPIMAIRTDIAYESLEQLLPDYSIHESRRYSIDQETD